MLPHTCDVSRVSFDGDQASLITFGRRVPPASGAVEGRAASPRSMEVRRWSILKDEQPFERFTQLGEFLGMREFNVNQQLSLLSDPAKLARLWESYRKRAEALPEAGRAGDFHLAEARLAEASGDNASAAWHLRQAGDLPKDIDRLTDEARIFAAVRDWKRVIAASEQAKSATQSDGLLQDMLEKHAEARLELGSARAENGDLGLAKPDIELALSDYRAVADRDPKGAYWRTQQAEALTLLKRYPEAIAALDEAIRLNASPRHFQMKASIHLRLGDAAAYDADCKAALARFPDGDKHPSAIWCCLLDALPNFDLANLAPALKKDPGSFEQRNTLGALLYRLGGMENTEQSIEVLHDSVRLFERSALRQRRDVYAVDASLPEGRPLDWIFLAMAHLRRAADDTLSPPERDRHRERARIFRDAVDKVLVKNGPLGEFGAGAIAWKRLELEVLRAGCDRDYPRPAGP